MKLLYDLYQLCIALPLLLLLTILTALTTTIGSMLGGAHFWGYYPAKIWSRLICYLLFLPVHVEGREKLHRHTSYVFVPNHQGAFDIFLVYGFLNRPFKWMMKKSLEKIPFVGFACKRAGHILVDNSGVGAVKSTMREAEKMLKGGMSIVVFPEGSRTKTGKMSRFKCGAFRLAQEFSLPIVPITINGAFDVMPRTSLLPFCGSITLKIHDAIVAPVDDADVKNKMAEAYAAVYEGLDDK